jgi:arginine-tRNA-protein transferase
MIPRLDESFVALAMAPVEMDALWEEGWRHFGPVFYRYTKAEAGGGPKRVMPLRVDLSRFAPSKSQRRVLRRNADLDVRVQSPVLDAERRALFDAHHMRFTDNVPNSLDDFLGPAPALLPCRTVEVAAYAHGRLVAASYLDVGCRSASSIYAMFDPAESRRSLGIATMLWEIGHAKCHGFAHYYPGYCFHEPTSFDYKRAFAGTEWFDWRGAWRPLEP